jgi:hypothetical protein
MFNNKKIELLEFRIDEMERQIKVMSKYVEKTMELAEQQVLKIAEKYLESKEARDD